MATDFFQLLLIFLLHYYYYYYYILFVVSYYFKNHTCIKKEIFSLLFTNFLCPPVLVSVPSPVLQWQML